MSQESQSFFRDFTAHVLHMHVLNAQARVERLETRVEEEGGDYATHALASRLRDAREHLRLALVRENHLIWTRLQHGV